MFAAGQGRRFGSDKRFAELSSGLPLWRQSLSVLLAAGLPVTLVVRPGEQIRFIAELPASAAARVTVFGAPRAHEGLGGAIASTITTVTADAVLIALGDMPWLEPATVRAVAAQLVHHPIVVPQLGDQPGHPVGFQRQLYPELAALTGDRGGRAIVERHADLVRRLPLSDRGIIRDIDRPGDLNRER
ncbi:MAG: nucleotidyltransferase family protein [Spongiibacteraceae bacterium]|jgi:molybdenum cofactor cytidylyltransferase|nr:nucleotidyltransferase family protein [Spongiibacteraceae bacterium]